MTCKRFSIALWTITALTMISISEAYADRPDAKLMGVPLSFEPNQGQAASPVQFVSRGSGYALFLTPAKVVLNLGRQAPAAGVETLGMSLIGANAEAKPIALGRQSGVVSYFIGNDPKNWRSGIPTYGKVSYSQIYPGVDLVFYGNQRQLEYDFVVAPGADPSRIAWRIEGAHAGVDAVGNLTLRVASGPASFEKPRLYQMDGDKKTRVDGAFAVAGDEVRFQLGNYDHARALVIDPVLSYATYLAGSSSDTIGAPTGPGNLQVGTSQGLAVDSAGSAYVTGTTYSTDFPTMNPYQGTPPTFAAAFVSKFSPDGRSLVYSTYLGGSGGDHAYAIAVDSSGNAYVTGLTASPDFPITSGAYQTVCAPIPNNTGESVASSNCNSSDWNVFVTKLNPMGTGLVYSTFLGGYASWAYATAIAVDSAGRAYIAGNETDTCSAGYTFESCFPTTDGAVIGGTQPVGGDPQFAFVAAFDPTGANLLYSTLLGDMNFQCVIGCGGPTYGTGIAVDSGGYFYLVGETTASTLPTTAGVVQPTGAPLGSPANALQVWRGFVAKFNPVTSAGGASLAYCTYLGGKAPSEGDYISGVTIDSSGNAYIVGYTNSPDFPVTFGAYGTTCAPNGGTCSAAHVTKLNSSGSAIVWSTFVGGAKSDGSDGLYFTGPIQLDGNGNIYIMGQAGPDFPLLNAVEPAVSGGSMEVAVAELDPTAANLLFFTRIGSGGLDTANPAGLAVDSAGTIYLAGNNAGPDLITTPGAFQTTANDSSCCYHGFVAKIEPPPAVNAGGVLNAGSYTTAGVAPGSIVSIFGTNLAASTASAGAIPLPAALSDVTSVTFNNIPAGLYFVSQYQINAQLPFNVLSGQGSATVNIVVTRSSGTSTAQNVTVTPASPGIFTTTANGLGQAFAYDNTTGALAAPAGMAVGSLATAPISISAGHALIIACTGLGAVQPSIDNYVAASDGTFRYTALQPTVLIGGVAATPIYSVLSPQFVSEYQIGVIPAANTPTGDAVSLQIQIGGVTTTKQVTIAVGP